MKDFFKRLVSKSDEVSSKRIVGLLAFVLLCIMVIVHLINYKIIQSELIYTVAAIISACFGLNALIDAKAYSNNKVVDNLKQLLKEEKSNEPNLVAPIKEEVVSSKEISKEDVNKIKIEFKKPLDGINADNLLRAGSAYIGIKEVSGGDSNSTILEFAKKAGITWYNSDEIAWCAIFVNAMCDIVGLPETNSALAKSFLKWGVPITLAEAKNNPKNVVAVFNRGKANSMYGHVGILESIVNDKFVNILGGNQNNSVCVAKFPLDENFLGFRRGVWEKVQTA